MEIDMTPALPHETADSSAYQNNHAAVAHSAAAAAFQESTYIPEPAGRKRMAENRKRMSQNGEARLAELESLAQKHSVCVTPAVAVPAMPPLTGVSK